MIEQRGPDRAPPERPASQPTGEPKARPRGRCVSAAEAATDGLTIGLGPALSAVQLYLGGGLATQIGLFDAVGRQQGQSVVGMATAVAAVARVLSRGRGGDREAKSISNVYLTEAQASAPASQKTPVERVHEAAATASKAMADSEQTMAGHGF